MALLALASLLAIMALLVLAALPAIMALLELAPLLVIMGHQGLREDPVQVILVLLALGGEAHLQIILVLLMLAALQTPMALPVPSGGVRVQVILVQLAIPAPAALPALATRGSSSALVEEPWFALQVIIWGLNCVRVGQTESDAARGRV